MHEHGGPEVLTWERLQVPAPGPGEVQVRHTAIGLNFIDIYERSGLYPQTLPVVLGREAAGIVISVGRGVRGLRVGQRVAYVSGGAYCELRNVPANRLVRLPPDIDDQRAAALMLKGLTAEALLRRVHRVRAGELLLVHAAAGGVGLLLCAWARTLGARVIGVVGSEAKVETARRHGCQRVLVAGRDDVVAAVRAYSRGHMADVVYDSVGRDTFIESLDCLRRRGLMVSFGNASGPVAPVAPLELQRRGSLYLTRPTLLDYIATRAELERAARALFAVVRSGKVRVRIGQRYPLEQAAQAHVDLQARRTIGSTVLIPRAAWHAAGG